MAGNAILKVPDADNRVVSCKITLNCIGRKPVLSSQASDSKDQFMVLFGQIRAITVCFVDSQGSAEKPLIRCTGRSEPSLAASVITRVF